CADHAPAPRARRPWPSSHRAGRRGGVGPLAIRVTERDGYTGFAVPGQSPLGLVEGSFNGGAYFERPATAKFLRSLGARSVGRVTLDDYVKTARESNKPAAQNPPQSR